ncbi:MAG: response regulator [Myxococcota bacterium]|jgi:CheY-like chemotaxis protein
MRILCIDDDSDILDTLRMSLESKGYTVQTAGSAVEGIRRFMEWKPEMVFVDMMMEEPDSGSVVIKAIRDSGSTVPVYLLSSIGESLCSISECSDLAFQDVLQKPISTGLLFKLVDAYQKNR